MLVESMPLPTMLITVKYANYVSVDTSHLLEQIKLHTLDTLTTFRYVTVIKIIF